MTASSHEPTPTHGGPREPLDVIQSGKVIGIGVGALVSFAVAILLVWIAFRALGGEQVFNPARVPRQVGHDTVGLLIQVPFSAMEQTPTYEAQRAWLHSYGWVDRQGGVIHIPIERAMELMLEDQANK